MGVSTICYSENLDRDPSQETRQTRPHLHVHRTKNRPGMDKHHSGGEDPYSGSKTAQLPAERREVPAPKELPIGRIGGLLYRLFGGNPDAKKEAYRRAIEEHLDVTGSWPYLRYVGDSLLISEDD